MAIYDIDGNVISTTEAPSVYIPDESPSPYDRIMKSINHRGWTQDGAVENSLAAYKASKEQGFYYVETDVRFTSDSYAILFHNDNIDGTLISNMTYAEVLEEVPTLALFTDFIALCRYIGLHPYIELKGTMTQANVNSLVDIVHAYQMRHRVTWFGSNGNVSKVQSYDTSARLGILSNTLTSTNVSQAQALKLDTNEVFLDTYISYLTSEILAMVKTAKVPLEVFTFGATKAEIKALDPYITGYTADTMIAGKVLHDDYIE